MAGKKRSEAFVPPEWRQALKAKFIDFGFRHNPHALELLATGVRKGVTTPHAWADSFDLANTWVEAWAESTIAFWEARPDCCLEMSESETKGPPVEVRYPPPHDAQTEEDVFKFHVKAVPTSKLSLGLTVGGSFGEDEPHDDFERFRRRMHRQLDLALDSYRAKSNGSRASRTLVVPRDLDRKVEAAALYFFRAQTPEELRANLMNRVGDRTTVNRWLKEILTLLELKLRQPGHLRKKVNVAADRR